MNIKKVAVIGAGTMGAGIAGQAANAGCEVLLLDLPSDGGDVNALAQKGLDRISNPQDLGILSPDVADRISVGNIRDDFDKLADCDWVAEAILERLDLKKDLYKKLGSPLPIFLIRCVSCLCWNLFRVKIPTLLLWRNSIHFAMNG